MELQFKILYHLLVENRTSEGAAFEETGKLAYLAKTDFIEHYGVFRFDTVRLNGKAI